MVGGQLEAGLEVLERQPVGRVAVDLVGRGEDEGRLRAVLAGRLEQVEGAVGVDPEVGLGVARRPVVGWLGGGVDDQLDLLGGLGEDTLDPLGVADVEVDRAKRGELAVEALGDVRGRCLGAEENGTGVVLDPDYVVAGLDQSRGRLGADQTPGSCDYRLRHRFRCPLCLLRKSQRGAQFVLMVGRPVKQVGEHVARPTPGAPGG
jgi:hypothetical protein